MNAIQKTAYNDPCFDAIECAKPKFKRYVEINGYILSVILTANIGLE